MRLELEKQAQSSLSPLQLNNEGMAQTGSCLILRDGQPEHQASDVGEAGFLGLP